MFVLHGKRVNIHAPHTDASGIVYASLTDANLRSMLGVIEVDEPPAPSDYSPLRYFRTEQDEAPWVVYTRKSDDAIASGQADQLRREINALETTAMLPRVVREFLLTLFSDKAADAGIDPLTNPAYVRLKSLDDRITSLRKDL